MKKIFKMLLSTLVCGAVLLGLRWAWQFLQANSTLGTTVDTLVYRCIAVLGLAAVLLYLRCWVSLIVKGVRARRVARARKESEPAFSIRLGMRDASTTPMKKDDRETKKPQPIRAEIASASEKAEASSADEKFAAPETAKPQPAASFKEPAAKDEPSREPALAGTAASGDGWTRSSDERKF